MSADCTSASVNLVSRWREAADRGHRCYAVVTGEAAWCRSWAGAVVPAMAPHAAVWIGEAGPDGVRCLAAGDAGQVLGGEHAVVVFDAHCGFDPDAFGAVTGTLRGGGVLLVLAPPLDAWADFADPEYRRLAVAPHGANGVRGRFLSRLVNVIARDRNICVIAQDGDGCSVELPENVPVSAGEVSGPFEPTADQQTAISAMINVVTGHRRRPLVLTSDRGRGKSAAMGMAAASLLSEGVASLRRAIVVTAPRASAVATLFDHCRRLLPEAGGRRYDVVTDGGVMRFIAPDELVSDMPPAHLLLVDEAAAVPAPLLEQLLKHYARVVFATTVHGYEGTGRSFAVRFQDTLNRLTPGWRRVRLTTPIRWAQNDPLERFVFEALLLNASAVADASLAGLRLSDCSTERLNRDELVASDTMLSELFGLLVLAHYRTRPFDLRLLLDAPNIGVYTVRFEGHVVATALVASEGGFDEREAEAIFQARVRPHGNLLPETLAVHGGAAQAPCLRYLRILRIAVHPAVQRRGVGRQLVASLVAHAGREGYDAVGVSFGATVDVLGFWEACGFKLLRVGLTRDHSSGTHSAVMLRALSAQATTMMTGVRRRLADNLPHQLLESLRNAEPGLVLEWLRLSAGAHEVLLSPSDEEACGAFAAGWCGYELVVASVWTLSQWAVGDRNAHAQLDDGQWRLLVLKVLQKKNWPEVVSALGFRGRQAALMSMREAVALLLAVRSQRYVGNGD